MLRCPSGPTRSLFSPHALFHHRSWSPKNREGGSRSPGRGSAGQHWVLPAVVGKEPMRLWHNIFAVASACERARTGSWRTPAARQRPSAANREAQADWAAVHGQPSIAATRCRARRRRNAAPPLSSSPRALPLRSAVARVYRESGTTVARNVRVADRNIDVPVVDDRLTGALRLSCGRTRRSQSMRC